MNRQVALNRFSSLVSFCLSNERCGDRLSRLRDYEVKQVELYLKEISENLGDVPLTQDEVGYIIGVTK